MAKFENMIPFILHFAAGVPTNKLTLPHDQLFEMARATGWSDDPDDQGGATMIDVTLKTYRSYRLRKGISTTTKADLKNISFEEWKDILKTCYWDLWKADEINSPGIAHMLVDWIWASGPKTIRNAQKLLGVKADGVVGPVTLSVINNRDPRQLFQDIYQARKRYYTQCKAAWKYLNGWLRRLDAIRPEGNFFASG